MTSTPPNKDAENSDTPSKEQLNEGQGVQHDQGEVSLDPHPSKALGELLAGNETTTPPDESSSKNA